MEAKQKANMLPNLHRFVTSELGENYWFNGCGRYVMRALGESDYDYEFFAGITGDIFAQVYTYNRFRGDDVTDYILSEGNKSFIEDIFRQCGYAVSYVPDKALKENPAPVKQMLYAQIDKGIPVISNLVIEEHDCWLVFVGYEDYGRTLFFMTDNMTQPESVSAESVLNAAQMREESRGLYFVGEKQEQKDIRQIYRNAILRLPTLLTTKTENYCFGADAFRAWADEIERGDFDGMTEEEMKGLPGWKRYTNYVCILATNGSCCHTFLERAQAYNPDFEFLAELRRLYWKMADMWMKDPDSLEALGGGFNISVETLKDPQRRAAIVAKIREFAEVADEILNVIKTNIKEN